MLVARVELQASRHNKPLFCELIFGYVQSQSQSELSWTETRRRARHSCHVQERMRSLQHYRLLGQPCNSFLSSPSGRGRGLDSRSLMSPLKSWRPCYRRNRWTQTRMKTSSIASFCGWDCCHMHLLVQRLCLAVFTARCRGAGLPLEWPTSACAADGLPGLAGAARQRGCGRGTTRG